MDHGVGLDRTQNRVQVDFDGGGGKQAVGRRLLHGGLSYCYWLQLLGFWGVAP